MTYTTDERLKSYLDTNQLQRERLCLAILSLDHRFSDVRPRHPRGGPDGGRDIEATFRKELLSYGAVGFLNQASDTDDNKRGIKRKFAEDLEAALKAEPRPQVFVFLTNVNLTAGEKQDLVSAATARGFTNCEVMDRERLRISLDSPDGLAARFQYLAIPLSEAEQASFFARWGDDINSVISTGFQEIRRTLEQILFLQESYAPIGSFRVEFELDREYAGDEIGHFRAFCLVKLLEPRLNIYSILFGSADVADRFDRDTEVSKCNSGIEHGVGGAQWQQLLQRDVAEPVPNNYVQVGRSSSVGQGQVRWVSIAYTTKSFMRFEPVLALRDFDGCWILPMLNRSLAERVIRIHVTCNGYKLLKLEKDDFRIDGSIWSPSVPAKFDDDELKDPWIRLRLYDGTSIRLSFAHEVPARMYTARQGNSMSRRLRDE